MSIYHFTQPGIIDEVTFRKNEKGAIRAYLHARPGTSLAAVQTIMQGLQELGMEYVPSTLNNRPMLEIRGFNREQDFVELLNGRRWANGAPHVYDEKTDSHGFIDIIRKRSLQASGAAMMAADTGFILYGIKKSGLKKLEDPKYKRDFRDALGGAAYFTGSSVLLGYGRNDQSRPQIREMANIILDYAREKGYTIPEDSSASTLGRRRKMTATQKVDAFFRENPSEIGNMMYVAAGGLIAWEALQNRTFAKFTKEMPADWVRDKRKGGIGDALLGSSTIASGLLATFLKEKAHDPDEPPKHGVSRLLEWIQERPLTIAGAGYIGSTLCHAYTTYVERKAAIATKNDKAASALAKKIATEELKAIPWRGVFIGATVIGELLLAISSKGHGTGVVSDNSVDKSVISIAAELIACQPEKDREPLIDYMGGFLGRQDVLAMKDADVIKALREQVYALCANPWVQCHSQNASCGLEKPAAMPGWQAKVASETPAATQLSV